MFFSFPYLIFCLRRWLAKVLQETPRLRDPDSSRQRNKYPATEGRLLIIPNHHFLNYFLATPDERTALWATVDEAKKLLNGRFKPDGYNVGINVGAVAEQTVLHCHIHLNPRRSADSVNLRASVRGVIAGKANYSGGG
jgi:diadenosine tetraphosphate (Ap4A) HIT family hydrolase